MERLQRELDRWVADGLVSAEQARAIRERYPDESVERRGRIVQALAVVGAVLAGLGVILFIAANWDGIPRPARVALLLAGMVAAYGGGWELRERRGTRPAVGEALYLVGALVFGASLFLVGQMYHVQAHDPLAFLVWTAVAAPLALVVRSRPLAALAVLTLGAWLVYEAIALAGDEGAGYVPVIAALYGAALYGGGTALPPSFRALLGGPMRGLGYAFWALGVFVFSFRAFFGALDDREPIGATVGVGLAALSLAALAGAAALVLRRRERRTAPFEAAALLTTVVLVVLAVLVLEESDAGFDGGGAIVYPILFNVLLAAVAIGAIVVGYLNDEVWLVNGGIAFVAVGIFARYVDLFWDLLPRSLVFVGAGLLVLLLAFVLERQRSRLVERMGEP